MLRKKSTARIDYELTHYKRPEKTNIVYHIDCLYCNSPFSFKEEELENQVIKCPYCGREEIFHRCNFESGTI